jgi:hypothetical protein
VARFAAIVNALFTAVILRNHPGGSRALIDGCPAVTSAKPAPRSIRTTASREKSMNIRTSWTGVQPNGPFVLAHHWMRAGKPKVKSSRASGHEPTLLEGLKTSGAADEGKYRKAWGCTVRRATMVAWLERLKDFSLIGLQQHPRQPGATLPNVGCACHRIEQVLAFQP